MRKFDNILFKGQKQSIKQLNEDLGIGNPGLYLYIKDYRGKKYNVDNMTIGLLNKLAIHENKTLDEMYKLIKDYNC